jgi:hypothetical protein
MEFSLRILPELRDFLDPLEPDEKETLEKLLIAEGCRDPIVVWEEENAILDGHNRYEMCKKHGIPYAVVHYSFPDIEAALNWMEENQNGRRNWSKESKKRYIERRLARGDTHKAIAEKVGLTRGRVTQIAKEVNNYPSDNSDKLSPTSELTPTENLEAIVQEKVQERVTQLEAMYQEKQSRAIAERVKLEHDAAEKRLAEMKAELESERGYTAEAAHSANAFWAEVQQLKAQLQEAKENAAVPEPVIVERVIEKPVPSPELEERLKQKEADLNAAMEALEEKSHVEEVAQRVNRESMEEHFKVREKVLQAKLAEKAKEMDEAAKAGLEVSELQKQKDQLHSEIANLRSDLEYETNVERIRKYFRKVESGVVDSLRIVEILKEKILQDPIFCRFTFEEMVSVRDDILHMHDATGEATSLLDRLLEQMREGLNLHVVK